MSASDRSIDELVKALINGKIQLPEMQRGYIWKKDKVKALIDSLYRGYPSGTILTWEMPEGSTLREAAIDQDKEGKPVELLLDGQQRLTSLACLMQGKTVEVVDRKIPIDIVFNLEHPDRIKAQEEQDDDSEHLNDANDEENDHDDEEAFAVAHKKHKNKSQWISVITIFKDETASKTLRDLGFKSSDDNWDKYEERIQKVRRIRDYQYRVVRLGEEMSYNEVTNIFVRVNSSGINLKKSDLALAQITAIWQGSLSKFQKCKENYSASKFNFDLSTLLRILIIIAKDKTALKEQAKFNNTHQLSGKQLQNAWEETKTSLDDAINFVKKRLNIESLTVLGSPFVMVTLAYLRYKRKEIFQGSEDQIKTIKEWVVRSSMKARYSSSPESALGQDISIIRNEKQNPLDELLTNLQTQFGKIDVHGGDLRSLKSNSPVFKTMYLAFRAAGAQDWMFNKLPISLELMGKKNKIENHHIFPRALLGKQGLDEDKINNIANLTFISAATNRDISDQLPKDYLSDLSPKELELHCIPQDRALWELNQYDKFLKERRDLIAKCINDYCDEL
jgi:hypothetical protein